MTSPYAFREAFQEIMQRCEALFVLKEGDGCGPPASEAEIAAELTDNDCQGKLAKQLLEYTHSANGFDLEWRHTAAQAKLKLPGGYWGYIHLVSLSDLCRDWYDEFGGEVVEEHNPDLAQHLRELRMLDHFDQTGCVGVYCNEKRDPELYFYDSGEGEFPAPLGVDLVGYIELLKLSLGYQHWQLLLIELNEYFNAPAPRMPFQYQSSLSNPQDFVDDMTALDPTFSLEAFMARYEQVRLCR
jgi:hypothetical protein